MIPGIVFLEEARHLKPVPELSKPVKSQTPIVRKTNVIHYGQNRYEVPKGTYFPGRKARIVLDEQGENVSFYDAKTGELLAGHAVDKGAGRLVRLKRNTGRAAGKMANLLKDKLLTALNGFDGAKIYVEWLIEKYPRYVRDQLRIMYQCVTEYSREELKQALDYCVERDLIKEPREQRRRVYKTPGFCGVLCAVFAKRKFRSANDFRDTLVFFRQDEPKITPAPVVLPAKYQTVVPKVRNIAGYIKAAKNRGNA